MNHFLPALGLACLVASASIAEIPADEFFRANAYDASGTLRPDGVLADSTSPGIKALDAKNGFRGFTLGEPIAKYPDLKQRGANMYQARNEPMTVGDTRLSMLWFGAEQGRLASIFLIASGKKNAEQLLASLRAQYGEGEPDARGRIRWRGTKVGMVYEYAAYNKYNGTQEANGTVTIYSLELGQAVKKMLGE